MKENAAGSRTQFGMMVGQFKDSRERIRVVQLISIYCKALNEIKPTLNNHLRLIQPVERSVGKIS